MTSPTTFQYNKYRPYIQHAGPKQTIQPDDHTKFEIIDPNNESRFIQDPHPNVQIYQQDEPT